MRHLIRKAASFFLATLFLLMPAVPVHAAGDTPVGENTGWVRARLDYEYDEGIIGLDDSIIDFADGWEKKDDGWYYYKSSVKPGDKVRFITCVHVPAEWTEKLENKKFCIIATAELSEVAPKDSGWDANTEIHYKKTFDVWNMGYQHDEDVWIEEGRTTIKINEYQLDKDGEEVPYKNDKLITPGQPVSKIVELEIDGTMGANVKLKPEKPVKTVRCNGVDVDGKDVDYGSVLTYSILVKNPAPDERTITITDQVDTRLIILDTHGDDAEWEGVIVKEPVNGRGGTIKWEVTVPGYGSASVGFTAQAAEDVQDETIPNTADATIVGICMKSNTTLTGIGSPPVIEKVIARATYDTANFFGVLVLLATGIITAAIVGIKLIRRMKGDKKDEEKTD